jgi:outer membrane protein TolC
VRDEFKDTWDIGVAASFDIWNWGTTIHQTNQARAQLEQSKDALGLVRDRITFEVTEAYLSHRQAQEKIAVAEQAVAHAEENHRTTVEKFKAGVALNTDVLDAETSLLQARTNYTQALVDYELAVARLEKSIGK